MPNIKIHCKLIQIVRCMLWIENNVILYIYYHYMSVYRGKTYTYKPVSPSTKVVNLMKVHYRVQIQNPSLETNI
jgi:hypothetical protein